MTQQLLQPPVLPYQSPPPSQSAYSWLVVSMLWCVCLFNYADRQAIYSVFPLLKSEMQLSDVQLGIVGGSFMWVYAAALPFAGIIGDTFSRKSLILGGLIFWSLITLATALSTKYWHLVLFRGLEGLGEAFYFPASMSLISDYHSPRTRSRAMSFHQSSVYVGTIAGGTAAGFLAQKYGWRSGFYLFGFLGVVLGIILIFTLKEPRRGQADQIQVPHDNEPILPAIVSILSTPMVLILILVFTGANFVAAIFLTWMPSYLNRTFSMSLSMAGLNATFWLQIASILGVISGGFLADKLARRYGGGRMITQSFGLLLGVPFIFLTGWTTAIPILVIAMIGFGFFKGLYDANIWASLYDVVPLRRRATALGLMNAIGWFGGGAGAVTIAILSKKYGMSASLSATSAIYLIFGSILLLGTALFMSNRRVNQ
ncbi:MAG TPA: MFS transporter [Tepidisphaeraceae bacterium]|nr:MFS transporter [Tepidisphaeraceae bacterium]